MNNRLVAGAMLALLAACSAQDEAPPAGEAATAPATAAAAPAEPAAASPAAFAAGAIVEATRQTQCRETGAGAGEPWDVAPGAFAKVIAVQGSEILVDMAASECLIPADAVKLSES